MIGVVVLFLSCLVATEAATANEINALRNLFTSTNGNGWQVRTNWNSGDPCSNSWAGIECNGGGNVIGINLISNNLVGQLPSDLGNLFALTYLFLSDNQISGAIPNSINSLTRATIIYLQNNALSDSVPNIASLTALTQLHLDQNQLTGAFPSVSTLNSLVVLRLERNRFTSIPPSFPNSLQDLRLSFNNIAGPLPAALFSHPALKSLELNDNSFSGPIPDTTLGANILEIDLANNMLGCVIPDWVVSSTIDIDLTGNTFMCPLRGVDAICNTFSIAVSPLEVLKNSLATLTITTSSPLDYLAGCGTIYCFYGKTRGPAAVPTSPTTFTCEVINSQVFVPISLKTFSGLQVSSNVVTVTFKADCPLNCSFPNGECISLDKGCVCKPQYTGLNCSDIRCPRDCSTHGTCDYSTGICTCDPGWDATDCSREKKVCSPSPNCNGNGFCNDIVGLCNCLPAFTGTSCEDRVCPGSCSGHGICDKINGNCSCDTTPVVYSGPACNIVEKECDPPCAGTGECNKLEGVCACYPGFGGETCEEFLCLPLINGEECAGNGICNKTNGRCICDENRTGDYCQIANFPCPIGRDGLVCSGPGWGSCDSTTGNCVCRDATFLKPACSARSCESLCVLESGCGPTFCNNGTCVDDPVAPLQCVCDEGYEGDVCERKLCEFDCGDQGQCNFFTGLCECFEGYEGPKCDEKICPGSDQTIKCSGHGTCNKGTGLCACETRWGTQGNPKDQNTACNFEQPNVPLIVGVVIAALVAIAILAILAFFALRAAAIKKLKAKK